MTVTVINSVGNFETWSEKLLGEVSKGNFSDVIGKLLFENDQIKLWEIVLEPGERLPFRYHFNNFSCTYFTEGLLVVRNINGQVILKRFNKGDHYFVQYKSVIVSDTENIGENTVKIAIVEEKTPLNIE